MSTVSRTPKKKNVVKQFSIALKRAVDDGVVTVQDLHDLTGVSRNQIYKWMRNENAPSLKNAELIAAQIGMKIEIVPAS